MFSLLLGPVLLTKHCLPYVCINRSTFASHFVSSDVFIIKPSITNQYRDSTLKEAKLRKGLNLRPCILILCRRTNRISGDLIWAFLQALIFRLNRRSLFYKNLCLFCSFEDLTRQAPRLDNVGDLRWVFESKHHFLEACECMDGKGEAQ